MLRRLGIATLLVLAPACSGGGDDGPDPTPEPTPLPSLCLASPGGRAQFTDRRDAWGLGDDALDVEGGRISAADLTGDGFPEVLVHRVGANNRSAPDGPRPYYLLRNEGGQLVDATDASGYGGPMRPVAHLAVFGDVDGDGDLDIFSGVLTDSQGDSGDRSRLLLNDGSGVFTAGPAPIPAEVDGSAVTAASFLDFDADGQLDLFIGNGFGTFGRLDLTQQDLLLRGLGEGSFEEATATAGLLTRAPVLFGDIDIEAMNEGRTHRPTYGAAACDVDGDADTDLLGVSYGRQLNSLWVNSGGTFVNQSVASDFAYDALTDFADNQLFACHCALDDDCEPEVRPIIQCDQSRWNEGIDDQAFRLGGNTFAVACADLDDDGRADVLTGEIRHWWTGASSDPSQLLRGIGEIDAPRFERPGNEALGLTRSWENPDWNEGDIFAVVFDYDLDGLKDILWGSTDYAEQTASLFRQMPDGSFEDVTDEAGLRHHRAAGIAVADLDRDGDQDIVMGSSTMRCSANDNPPCPWAGGVGANVFVYENDASEHHNWLGVELVGPAGGVGARVSVTAGGRTQHYELGAGHGHFGQQHTQTLHIGLGSACEIDGVEVRWPGGATTTYSGLRANTFVRLDVSGTATER